MQKIIAYLKDPKNFLIIIGEPGTSKTYFCAALAHWILSTFNTHRYWLEEKLLERLQEGFDSNEGSPKALKYLIDDHLIILDDVGSNGWSTWKEKVLFNLIDARYNTMMPTIITSNLTRSEFYKTYEPRTCSRLFAAENTIIELEGVKDFRA